MTLNEIVLLGVSYGYPISDTQRLSFGRTGERKYGKLRYDPNPMKLPRLCPIRQWRTITTLIYWQALTWSDSDLVGGVLPTGWFTQPKLLLEVALPVGDQQYAKPWNSNVAKILEFKQF